MTGDPTELAPPRLQELALLKELALLREPDLVRCRVAVLATCCRLSRAVLQGEALLGEDGRAALVGGPSWQLMCACRGGGATTQHPSILCPLRCAGSRTSSSSPWKGSFEQDKMESERAATNRHTHAYTPGPPRALPQVQVLKAQNTALACTLAATSSSTSSEECWSSAL